MRLWSIITATCLISVTTSLFAADYVWIEGERPTTIPELKSVDGDAAPDAIGFSGWGRTSIISAEEMLHVSLSSGEVEKFLPEEGLVFAYDFVIEGDGRQNVWARIGYEWVRSDFQWRIDQGPWHNCSRNEPTTNIQPLQTWNELAWIQLTQTDLEAGKHRIEFRHSAYQETDSRGNERTARILHMLDAICITPKAFRPNGKWKPDDAFQDQIDREADRNVFAISVGDGSLQRFETELSGWWTTAAWDENDVTDSSRLQPTTELPDLDSLAWYGYKVPNDRDVARPEMSFSHRYLVRTKLDVPASLRGRSFFLDFQNFSLTASVFLNGQFCGFSKTHSTAWQCDITSALKPGQINELVVVFKDAYYGLSTKYSETDRQIGPRQFWNLPRNMISHMSGGQHLDMPTAWDTRTGVLEPVSLVVAGPSYTTDVFCRPSVDDKQLGLDITVFNPTDQATTLEVENRVVPWNGGQGGAAEKTFAAETVLIDGRGAKTVALDESWDNPTLWWPDQPHLYWVVTTLKRDGKVIDVKRTRFGFRQWKWDSHMFTLNGVKWPMWADTNYTSSPQEFTELCQTSHMNQMRYWRKGDWGGMTRREVLNYFDETGMLVRSSGVFDGQAANYGGGLRVPDTSQPKDERGRYPLKAKPELFANWKHQMTSWLREERNHPCIYIWSVENEIAYINSNNLGQWREVEPALTDAVEHVMRVDPTRPAMVDGGNALRDESLPVNGAHYTEFMGVDFRDFPDAAYTREHFYNTLQRDAWRMVPNRPIMKGEVYFANGYSTDRFATIGGDRCFIGVGQTMEARGLWAKMLSEGYRWAEVSSWQFWMTDSERQYYNSWKPVAVLCRQWNWTFGAGNTIERTLKVFNNTRHATPIDVQWTVEVGDQQIAHQTRRFDVPPGEAEQFAIDFTTPKVTSRTAGRLILCASRDGQELFHDEKPLAIIAPNAIRKPSLAESELAVFDPLGTVKAHLVSRDIPFTEMQRPDRAPPAAKVVVLGTDSIPEELVADPFCYRYALEGRRVIVLDQTHPLRYQAIPADLSPTEFVGRFGFAEDLSHPAFRGLDQGDFFTWGNDHVMYRNAYRKGTKGGRSLLQCDDRLSCTALVESSVGNGAILLSQLAIGERLQTLGVAQAVFNNLLNYAAEYEPVRKSTYAAFDPDGPEKRLFDALNLQYELVDSPLAALQEDGIAVIKATPTHLKQLAAAYPQVQEFCQRGGWLMLWGLTPEGLADYNRIVGHEHVIRPFRMERVLLSIPRDPLTAGLTLRDVVMDTGEKIFGWMALKWPDEDAFQYIVDHTDIAPFAELPTPEELGKESDRAVRGSDHWPANLTNGFTSDDTWRLTYSIILDAGHKTKWTMDLPKEEELVSLKIKTNQIYHKITKINLYVDDDPEPVVAQLRPDGAIQEVPLDGKTGKRITFEIADWEETGRQNVIGIDNFWLYVKRDEDYLNSTRPLLNIGGLMRYDRGQGGIVLNQLNILDREKLPLNKSKKANITKALLANMGAVFAGTKTIVAGAGLRYEPVMIPDASFNAYVNRSGRPRWFPGPGDLSKIPVGRQNFANVDYYLSDFSTSPVPTVFMLKGNGSEVEESEIQGLRVDRTADAIFFLHTFHPSGSISGWQRNRDQAIQRGRELPEAPVVFQYVVHYADGTQQLAPVTWQKEVGPWLVGAPAALPAAAVAWTMPLSDEEQAVVYSMQWNNPRPDVEIESIDIISSPDGPKWGAPAVFAITTATAVE
jgi:hypothetical protein